MKTLALLLITAAASTAFGGELAPELAAYAEARIGEFDQIDPVRVEQLKRLAAYVRSQVEGGERVRLTFICTHNSRRSHLSQLWAAVAADHFRVAGVTTYSGGTEATAFNPRAVAALRRAGFLIDQPTWAANPRYEVRFAEGAEPQVCFSKVYDESPNPTNGFCAVMTCAQADRSCPNVIGAAERIAIPYEDPKVADNTLLEAEKYDERCAQIARELLYAFSLAAE